MAGFLWFSEGKTNSYCRGLQQLSPTNQRSRSQAGLKGQLCKEILGREKGSNKGKRMNKTNKTFRHKILIQILWRTYVYSICSKFKKVCFAFKIFKILFDWQNFMLIYYKYTYTNMNYNIVFGRTLQLYIYIY